jgi:hypothetical protein
MLTKQQAFLWGVFGGIAPEVVRFTVLAKTARIDAPPSGWILYIALSILYTACAGILAIAWKPENEFKAIWVGASFPAILATLVGSIPKLPS